MPPNIPSFCAVFHLIFSTLIITAMNFIAFQIFAPLIPINYCIFDYNVGRNLAYTLVDTSENVSVRRHSVLIVIGSALSSSGKLVRICPNMIRQLVYAFGLAIVIIAAQYENVF